MEAPLWDTFPPPKSCQSGKRIRHIQMTSPAIILGSGKPIQGIAVSPICHAQFDAVNGTLTTLRWWWRGFENWGAEMEKAIITAHVGKMMRPNMWQLIGMAHY